MAANAPYAVKSIPLYLNSLTGMRYRQIHCIECGTPVFERNSDMIYRYDNDRPEQVAIIDSEAIRATCPHCTQVYDLRISLTTRYDPDAPALYMHPQTIQLAIEPIKTLRDIHCMEDGKSMDMISDRVAFISDNRVQFEYVDPAKVGPIGKYCPARSCHQYWSIMV
jgi:hypothetical protein